LANKDDALVAHRVGEMENSEKNGQASQQKSQINSTKHSKDNKLATRGTGGFKGKSGSIFKKGAENYVELIGAQHKENSSASNFTFTPTNMGSLLGSQGARVTTSETKGLQYNNEVCDSILGLNDNLSLAPEKTILPNVQGLQICFLHPTNKYRLFITLKLYQCWMVKTLWMLQTREKIL
jgi:hypothetical protein